MKKVLFATTALVAFAGAAAAEVTVSGDARMGITYQEGAADEFQANHRVRIKFTATGTTDGGLEWEAAARFRAGHEINAAGAGTDTNAVNQIGVTISGAFGSLTFGSESSAAEYAIGDLAGVSYGPGKVNNETKFINGAAALYSYTTGGLTFYASAGQIGSEEFSVGAKYSVDALTVGIGYEDADGDNQIIGSASYTFGNTTVKGIYGKSDVADTAAADGICQTATAGAVTNATYTAAAGCTGTVIKAATAAASGMDSQWGLSVSHKMGAATLKGYYRTVETNDGAEKDYYGVGADYALGGGATLAGGVSSNDGQTSANFGLKFSF